MEAIVNIAVSVCVARDWARDGRRVVVPVVMMTAGMLFPVEYSVFSNVRPRAARVQRVHYWAACHALL